MKKRFYKTGIVLGVIFNLYLLIVIIMVQTRNENITAFAFISGLVPFIGGIGCVTWFGMFIASAFAKEVSIQDYKLPVALTSVAVLIIAIFLL